MPGSFVPFAENTGAIKAVTGAVLDLVLDQVVRWREAGVSVPVAVNVSAHDVNDPGFADRVAEMLAGRGLDGTSLVIELTETALLADPDAASVVLWRLAQMGVEVAIDDFGSGYASLLYLRRFPVSVLKLDRSLVQGLTVDSTDAALVRWTIEMAHALRVTCIAEGVEDVATLEALEVLGCDQAQGYHLQVPVSAEDLALDRAVVRP
jgi:EAL domain-containing protein (putative c-di-GMP-specific phosphodiesterase class I)